MRLLCIILASIAATVMADCDPSDCCYKSERTCESHGRRDVYCANMLIRMQHSLITIPTFRYPQTRRAVYRD
ncbi:hypothetical protein GT037_007134 [Alternaria burnsii]|uniref:Uncharacterized protein n=1 Tax=Alternaria burnsii TaxID=1187904 RepID=A0A8H7AZS0_9PLEO|nr:uncharacterized protein GT037_007134 [Alternaria burnsii]KAF7674374.1 hypothetical protein GT037_007134 [Alternaria burnsii]